MTLFRSRCLHPLRWLLLLFFPLTAAALFFLFRQPGPDLDILLITIDTLRSDHLSCYGYERETTPFLDSLARQGAVFLDCRATSSWTAPSMASIFTTMAFHWAARRDRYPEQLKDGLTPHAAQKLYYATAAFTLPDRPPAPPPPWTATIDITPFLEEKILATREHVTQAPLMKKFRSVVKKFGSSELFHLAASTHPKEIELETDLLAGISE